MGTITSREACVDHVIGSAYQVVRYVAANMQSIIDVSGALPQLELWMPSIASVLAAMPTISNVNTNLPVIANVNSNLTMLSNVNANMAALLNINSNMTALLAIPGVIQAQDFKNSVAVATTANIALTGLQTIDGYSVPVGARVLVKNQTAPAENGIYVAATGAWARSSDGAAGMLSTGCQVSVDRGTVGAGKQFRLATLVTITVGTTAQSWVEMSSASNVVGQEDDGTPLTVLAPHELQFDNQHFSLTAVAQGVAIALSTEILDAIAAGGGGGGGVPEAPNDGNLYVRASLDWVEFKFNQDSMMNMGTISLVSPSASMDNRMKFRGLVEKVVEGKKEILITPIASGELPDLNDLQISLPPRYKSEWDGYYEGSFYWNERLALGGDCNIDSSIATAISAFTANTVYAYPFYVPIGGTIFENLGLIFDTSTRPASGNLGVSIAKMSGNYMTILSYHTFVWSVLNQTPQLSPAVELDEPCVYVAFLRTTTNAATWKSARKVNATPALRMGTDPASKVLMDSLQPRWSIAWKFTSLDPLIVGWTIGYESLDGTGVTTAPYAELMTKFTGG